MRSLKCPKCKEEMVSWHDFNHKYVCKNEDCEFYGILRWNWRAWVDTEIGDV